MGAIVLNRQKEQVARYYVHENALWAQKLVKNDQHAASGEEFAPRGKRAKRFIANRSGVEWSLFQSQQRGKPVVSGAHVPDEAQAPSCLS